jgi:hypothetical protein
VAQGEGLCSSSSTTKTKSGFGIIVFSMLCVIFKWFFTN